ncbi:hypothetical protein [Rhodococcus chondri]|uniref:Uncharacterized protein n=1 Tax=Rhodococcus chondri TaxID=3065941 RepID=A0ABU7JWF6_9NOCA|nr:hypothetical protein [Rhodococcus sp. CC-R104]MEE2034361.1 hypothetical protein [Rhodococcus sp. CC-R104]
MLVTLCDRRQRRRSACADRREELVAGDAARAVDVPGEEQVAFVGVHGGDRRGEFVVAHRRRHVPDDLSLAVHAMRVDRQHVV